VKSSLAVLLLLLSSCSPPPSSFEQLRHAGYEELRAGKLLAALEHAEEGQRRARSEREGHWQWVFQVLEAEVKVYQRRDFDGVIALLDGGLRSHVARDEVYARALMTRAFAVCMSADAKGAAPEDLSRAEAGLDEADRLAAAIGVGAMAAEVALRRGNCLLSKEDYSGGEAAFREALAIARRKKLNLLEAQAAGSLGMLRANQRRFDDATDWLRQSLNSTPLGEADSLRYKGLGNLGWCYLMLGDYPRALRMLAESQALATADGSDGDRLIALTNMARARYRARDAGGARDELARALALARKMEDSNTTAELLNNLATLALEGGQFDEAEGHVREVQRLATQTANEDGRLRALLTEGQIHAGRGHYEEAARPYRDALASSRVRPELAWEAHALLAELGFRAGRLADAEREFRQAFALMEEALSLLRQDENRMLFFSSLRRFHESYVDFLTKAGRSDEALQAADQSRARLLQERLNLPVSRLHRGGNRFRKAAEATGGIILYYWTTAERSLLWIVTPQSIQLRVLPGEAAIAEHVQAYERAILDAHEPLVEGSRAGEWLYRNLIAPAEIQIPRGSRVVVLPDGALHRLNFEALVVPGSRPHYWIEDVTVITAASAGVLSGYSARPPGRARNLLLIGDPLSPDPDFPRLAHTAREVIGLGSLFDPARRSVYSGFEAQPAAYRSARPESFAFIHFAAHATANDESPLDSAIVLSPRGEEYKLHARDIVDIPLEADVVTLSACRGAGSRSYAGEGLVGLAWAFLSTGAHHVVAGLWDVDDASTADLMEGFYREMKHGSGAPEALRAAKLQLLKSATVQRKPFYWAPFLLYMGPGSAQTHSIRSPAR
jgi:CHAT domain-containing protein/Flp pilus assembly protein TadD